MIKSINESNLNREQFEQLKERYVDTIVDSMSTKDLVDYVANEMYVSMNSITESEIINDISFYFEDHFNDIVSEVREGII